MFPFPAPLGAYHFENRPAVPITTGARSSSAQSTAISLGAAVAGDFMIFGNPTAPAGGAGGWLASSPSGYFWSKQLEAADLVPAALTGPTDMWIFVVYRGPKSVVVKASGTGSGGAGVNLAGFTKHARSGGVVLIGFGNGTVMVPVSSPANWPTVRIQAINTQFGPVISRRMWDKLGPTDQYVDGTNGNLGASGTSTQGVLAELLNV